MILSQTLLISDVNTIRFPLAHRDQLVLSQAGSPSQIVGAQCHEKQFSLRELIIRLSQHAVAHQPSIAHRYGNAYLCTVVSRCCVHLKSNEYK